MSTELYLYDEPAGDTSLDKVDSQHPLPIKLVDKQGATVNAPSEDVDVAVAAYWSVSHNPTVGVVATATQVANTSGHQRNIVTEISASLCGDATGATAVQLIIVLRDGASGSGTIKRSWNMALLATAGAMAPSIVLTGLWIPMSAGQQTTLEFTAAGGGHTYEAVNMSGFTY